MTSRSFLAQTLLTFAAVGAAFVIGRSTDLGAGPRLDAQGVTTNGPPPMIPPIVTPVGPGSGAGNSAPATMLPYSEGSGGAAIGSNGILAVTGSYGVGTSVLYVIDTESRQLAVYEARGGSRSMRRLTLVGARRIDLDLQLRGYNDESDYQYATLEKMFDGRRLQGSGSGSDHTIDSSAKKR